MVSHIFRPPALGRRRLASVEDVPTIMELVNESMSRNFRIARQSDIAYLIENSVITIVQLDINETIVGSLSLKDYPVIPSVHPQAWEEYIWTKYKSVELNSRNTLFVHLMCWSAEYARDIVDSMLQSVFMHDAYVLYIGMVKSVLSHPTLIPGTSRPEMSFRRVGAVEKGVQGDRLPALYIAERAEINPRLKIRRAVEEDNDDIVPIIEHHSAQLREMYGDFYISELISRHPESERVLLVCESKELAVGVMCLNTRINFETLEESFELSPFAGLRRHTEPCTMVANQNESNVSFMSQINMAERTKPESKTRVKDIESRVTWLYNENQFKSFQGMESKWNDVEAEPSVRLSPSTHLDVINMLGEEDELEYNIINIDTDLMRVPKILSYDGMYAEGTAGNTTKVLDNTPPCSNDKYNKEPVKRLPALDKPPEPKRYVGEPNAFIMELFAIHEEYDERHGFDVLEAAFDMFPNRDYCIVCLPSNHSSFPLLEHFTLVTPYSYRMRFINETLYVAHVNSVRGDLRVREGEACDMDAILDVLEHAPRAGAIADMFESSLKSLTLQAFVLLNQNQPVGMVVLGPLEDGTSIRTQFDLESEPRRAGTDGAVLAGVVSPVMEPHNRWFMRELLRLCQYSTLFWMCRLFDRGDSSASRNLMSLAGHMLPVRPRRAVPNLTGNKDLDDIFMDVSMPFAVWVLERPLSSFPKLYVNNSIVVVGSSHTGLAFLETLFLGPTCKYLTFSNVTLVSEHGLPTFAECLEAAHTCVPKDGRYTDRHLKTVPFYFYLDVVSAVMIGIDRKNKCILLKSGGVKYYDELVLTCGQQFQHPDYLRDPLELVKEVELGKPCDRMLMDNPRYQPDKVPLPPDMPENVMVINSLYQADICLRKLLGMITDFKNSSYSLSSDNPVVVYGESIEAYSCMAALLEVGLSPEVITFVEPFPSEDHAKLRVNCFNNETIDERVQGNLEQIGIRVYRNSHLLGWRQCNIHVEALHLMSPLQTICIPCFALFYYGLKAIDIYAFKAINESGLVYDGGLVVGPDYDTNDPHVFGAGTCTKFSRRLYADPLTHRYYCSEDVGEALAKLFLKKLDPFVMSADPAGDSTELTPKLNSSLLAWQPVVKFDSPICQSATLPGPLYYMKLRKPGIEIPMEVQMCLPHRGHTLLTDKSGNYFRLQLNVLHCVAAVTCLSKKPFSSEVLSQLYGKHEALFNKLLTRYQMQLIPDLYDFFTQPWMAALYQETFEVLLRDVNSQDVGTVYDLVKSRFTLYDEGVKFKEMSQSYQEMSHACMCSTDPSGGYGTQDAHPLGTFRSVIDKFVAKTSSVQVVKAGRSVDIPTECGQSAAKRSDVAYFWTAVGGERTVVSHLARYLTRNITTHPQYATPDPELI